MLYMLLKSAPLLLLTTIYAYAADNEQREALLQEALLSGHMCPCETARNIEQKYGPLFTLAVKQCNSKSQLEHIAGLDSCGVSCLRILHTEGINLDAPHLYSSIASIGRKTPLCMAVCSDNIEKATYLVDHGAQVVRNSGNNPVDCAIHRIEHSIREHIIRDRSYVPNIAMLLVLQNSTPDNILNPTRYTFYRNYLQLLLNPPQCSDVDVHRRRGKYAIWASNLREDECIPLYVYKQMYETLKRAEKQYFEKIHASHHPPRK